MTHSHCSYHHGRIAEHEPLTALERMVLVLIWMASIASSLWFLGYCVSLALP